MNANDYYLMEAALRSAQYKKVEHLATNCIKTSPTHVHGWIYLGKSLLNQGYGEAASKVFERAWLLDPHGTWVDSIQLLLSKIPDGPVRKDIESLLKIKQLTVASATITKNEAHNIHRCLSSLEDAVDEIVVIDTGSTDETIEIARSFPKVKIVSFSWCDDFAAARNAGLPHINSNWVIWVDADEYLHPDDVQSVRKVAGLYDNIKPDPVLYLDIINHDKNGNKLDGLDNALLPRMFPIRTKLKFSGKVHEQIITPQGNKYEYGAFVRIRLFHDGYDIDVVKQKNKAERNIVLLQKMVEEQPEDPTWWYFYGRDLLNYGNLEEAINILTVTKNKARLTPGFVTLLFRTKLLLIKALLIKNDISLAEETCYRAMQICPDFPDVLYYLAIIQNKKAVNHLRSVEENLNKAKKYNTFRGVVLPDNQITQWKADLALADLAKLTGNLAVAEDTYQRLLNISPAKDAIQKQLDLIDSQRKQLNSRRGIKNNQDINFIKQIIEMSKTCLELIEHIIFRLNDGYFKETYKLLEDVVYAFSQIEKNINTSTNFITSNNIDKLTRELRIAIDKIVTCYEKYDKHTAQKVLENTLLPTYQKWQKEMELLN